MRMVAVTSVLVVLAFSLAVSAESSYYPPQWDRAKAIPVEEWPNEVVDYASTVPERYGADLPIEGLVDQVVSDYAGAGAELIVKFEVPLIDNNDVLVRASTMEGLPIDGPTDAELRTSNTNAHMTVPFSLSDFRSKADQTEASFGLHVKETLAGVLAGPESDTKAQSGSKWKTHQVCGEARLGTAFVIPQPIASHGTVSHRYVCASSTEGQGQSGWVLIESWFVPSSDSV